MDLANPPHQVLAADTLHGNYVLLRADTLRLLVPQADVGATEHIGGVPQATDDPGMFMLGEGDAVQAVVALSPDMRASVMFPADRFLLTPLRSQWGELSFAWNEVRVLIAPNFRRHALPTAIQLEGAPIDAYVEFDGALALCTTAERVMARVMTPSA